jgi:tetratricopeptide (TPR) repeat protein
MSLNQGVGRLLIIAQLLQSTLGRLFSRRRAVNANGGRAGTATPPPNPDAPRLPDRAAAQRWLKLGVNSAIAGQRDKARYCFTQAVRADDQNTRAWLYLAGVAGEPADALTAVQRALALEPDNEQAKVGYLWARYELGLLPLPEERVTSPLPGRATPALGFRPIAQPVERSVQPPSNPSSTRVWLGRGVDAAASGNRSYARYCFARAAETPINERRLDEVLLRRRAWLYLAGVAADPALALATLERVLAEEPDNTEALRGVRWAAERLNIKGYEPGKGWMTNGCIAEIGY